MAAKLTRPPQDDPEQSKRFIQAALDAGEAAPGEFERAFKKVTRRQKPQSLSARQNPSRAK
jgi:hypothetical protein